MIPRPTPISCARRLPTRAIRLPSRRIGNMATVELQVTGMTCDQCAGTVEQALAAVAGGERSRVSYQEGKVSVEAENAVDLAALVPAIKGKGSGAQLLDGA